MVKACRLADVSRRRDRGNCTVHREEDGGRSGYGGPAGSQVPPGWCATPGIGSLTPVPLVPDAAPGLAPRGLPASSRGYGRSVR
jgi:hypothetical protein